MENELAEETAEEPTGARRITPRRAKRQAPGTGSRLLSTMAVMVAAADEGKDYLAFFMPFVADRLKGWPQGQRVQPHELSAALCEEWGFPTVPSAVSLLLLQRAQKEQLVHNVDRAFYPNPEKLLARADLAEKKHEMLAELNALAAAVVQYAREIHELDWSEQRANRALERLSEDFGSELATAKREGQLSAGPSKEEDEALAVVYSFARRAVERDPVNFNRLVAMVQGTMIANALYFEDVRKLPSRLAELRIYLDTTPLIRALGLAPTEVVLAAREMLELMSSFRIPLFVFTHTIDEMSAILENIAAALKRGTRAYTEQGRIAGRAREAIDAAVAAGMSSGEMHSLVANLEQRLGELGVRRCETPPHEEAGHIDETRLGEVLGEVVGYGSKGPLDKDLDSLAAVERLRAGARPRELARTRALFVTANSGVARASREYFQSIKRDAPIPHCMTDIALTAQLWVRSSARKPELPRRMLIADCYSALAPSPALWQRWVSHIVKLRQGEKISEEQLQALIYHENTKALLFEVAHGREENVDERAVSEVLARLEADVRAPAETAAAAEREAAEREKQELSSQLAELGAWRRGQEAAQRAQAKAASERQARRRRLVRLGGGLIGAALIAGVFAALVAQEAIHGRFWWASASTAALFAGAGAVSWGLRKGWKAPLAVLVSAGALSTFWVNVFGVAGQSASGGGSGKSGQSSAVDGGGSRRGR